MSDIAYMIAEMKNLCDKWFLDPMIQPYAGANRECLFCGRTEHKIMTGEIYVNHSEDCPRTIYLKMLDSL